MAIVLACLDATPPTPESACVEQAWIEIPSTPMPTITVEQANEIGIALLWLVAGMAALKLIGKAA